MTDTAAQNEALFQQWAALFNARAPEGLEAIVAPDYVEHSPDSPSGPVGLQQFFAMIYAAFPDASLSIVHLIAEDDRVGGYVTIRGTHRGTFLGVAPTGRVIELHSLDMFRVADGKLVEHWEIVDRRGMFRQFDVAPDAV